MVIEPNKMINPRGESLSENFSAKELSLRITKRYLFLSWSVNIFHLLFFLSAIGKAQKYTKFRILTLLPYFCILFLKHIIKYILFSFAFVITLSGCKTNKNTFIHRGYHNLTARFNGYYYATESIKEGEEKIRANFKYDYDRLLPVYLVPDNETAKATFPEFDKAIKKSSNCIQRHTIKDKKGNEIYKAGKWIDNNWNVIGISHFYKREFFSGIEAFEYVVRSYKTKDRYKALIWLAKSQNEIGAPSQAEPVIGLLKDDKNISKYAKKELPVLQADYFLKRGMYKEAEAALIIALNGGDKKKKVDLNFLKSRTVKANRSRYAFILAQLYEEKKDNKKAIYYYQKAIDYKPAYDMVFNAKMKKARLADVKNGSIARLKRELMSMIKDVKNLEYLDQLYYTLGEISEKEKNVDQAITNYQLSIKNSTQNPKQKALSYLKLGEISFEQANYEASGAYYDSTMITLPKDYKDYNAINKRKTTLETLVGYIRTIQREDSLQRIAKMSDSDRERFIVKMIKKMEEDEERKKEEQEALLLQNQNPDFNAPVIPNNGLPVISNGGKADWYFYNQTTLSFGLNDFIKKWGNRKLEDNWRRSQKSLNFDNGNTTANDSTSTDSAAVVKNINPKATDKKNKDYYLTDLPLSDSLINASNIKIIDAYYNLGSTYKEELNNNKKAIAAYEELNKRYPDHKYKLSVYYQLYRIFASVKNQSQADYYKNKLLNEYPNSEYAQIIKNPNYVSDKNSEKGEVELFYTSTYDSYATGDYSRAYALSKESETKFGKNDFAPRFSLISAMSVGKLKGADSLETALKRHLVIYPKDATAQQAQNILDVLYNMKHPSEATSTNTAAVNQADTFALNLNSTHFVIAVCPDDATIANTFKGSLSAFNNSFYSNENLTVSSSLFGATEQIITIKQFKSAADAIKYVDNLKKDSSVFSGKVKTDSFTIMAISAENLPRLFRKKQTSYYKPFYEDHYK